MLVQSLIPSFVSSTYCCEYRLIYCNTPVAATFSVSHDFGDTPPYWPKLSLGLILGPKFRSSAAHGSVCQNARRRDGLFFIFLRYVSFLICVCFIRFYLIVFLIVTFTIHTLKPRDYSLKDIPYRMKGRKRVILAFVNGQREASQFKK